MTAIADWYGALPRSTNPVASTSPSQPIDSLTIPSPAMSSGLLIQRLTNARSTNHHSSFAAPASGVLKVPRQQSGTVTEELTWLIDEPCRQRLQYWEGSHCRGAGRECLRVSTLPGEPLAAELGECQEWPVGAGDFSFLHAIGWHSCPGNKQPIDGRICLEDGSAARGDWILVESGATNSRTAITGGSQKVPREDNLDVLNSGEEGPLA